MRREAEPGRSRSRSRSGRSAPRRCAGGSRARRRAGRGPRRSRPRRRSIKAAPRRTGRSPAAGARHPRAPRRRRRRPRPPASDDQGGDQHRRPDRDDQRQLDRAMRALLAVLGRNDPLKRAGHREVDDVGDQVHRPPQHDIEPVGRDPEQPGIERLRKRLDQRPGARQPGKPRPARDIAAGDGGGCEGGGAGRVVLHRGRGGSGFEKRRQRALGVCRRRAGQPITGHLRRNLSGPPGRA